MTSSDFLLQVIGATTSAAIGATVATQLALRSFYKQQVWSAKRKAYEDVLVALHAVRRHLNICQEWLADPVDPNDNFYQDHTQRQRDAWDEIAKSMDMGEYLMSPETTRVLKDLCDYWDSFGISELKFWELDILQKRSEKIADALDAVKICARIDLGLEEASWQAEISN